MKTRKNCRTVTTTKPTRSPAEEALVAKLLADGLSIQDRFLPNPRYKKTGKGVYRARTVTEIRRAKRIMKRTGLDSI
jgi:hypothetical protein